MFVDASWLRWRSESICHMNLHLKWPIELAQRFAIVESIKPVVDAVAVAAFILATLQRSCPAR